MATDKQTDQKLTLVCTAALVLAVIDLLIVVTVQVAR
jgi:hypothetical protein